MGAVAQSEWIVLISLPWYVLRAWAASPGLPPVVCLSRVALLVRHAPSGCRSRALCPALDTAEARSAPAVLRSEFVLVMISFVRDFKNCPKKCMQLLLKIPRRPE